MLDLFHESLQLAGEWAAAAVSPMPYLDPVMLMELTAPAADARGGWFQGMLKRVLSGGAVSYSKQQAEDLRQLWRMVAYSGHNKGSHVHPAKGLFAPLTVLHPVDPLRNVFAGVIPVTRGDKAHVMWSDVCVVSPMLWMQLQTDTWGGVAAKGVLNVRWLDYDQPNFLAAVLKETGAATNCA